MTLLPLMLTDADRFGLTPSQARRLPARAASHSHSSLPPRLSKVHSSQLPPQMSASISTPRHPTTSPCHHSHPFLHSSFSLALQPPRAPPSLAGWLFVRPAGLRQRHWRRPSGRPRRQARAGRPARAIPSGGRVRHGRLPPRCRRHAGGSALSVHGRGTSRAPRLTLWAGLPPPPPPPQPKPMVGPIHHPSPIPGLTTPLTFSSPDLSRPLWSSAGDQSPPFLSPRDRHALSSVTPPSRPPASPSGLSRAGPVGGGADSARVSPLGPRCQPGARGVAASGARGDAHGGGRWAAGERSSPPHPTPHPHRQPPTLPERPSLPPLPALSHSRLLSRPHPC